MDIADILAARANGKDSDSPLGVALTAMDFVLDVPLVVTVELGRTRLPLQELIQLKKGAVIELDKVAGEQLDLRVNGRLVARGEAVLVNEKYGVRVTSVHTEGGRVEVS